MKNKIKHTGRQLLALSLITFLLTGCGADPALTKFKNELEAFSTEVLAIDAGMNALDPTSETAREDLLDYLDQADDAFRKLANLSIPEEFSYLEELADEASEDMTQAVSLYHDAFGATSYNEYTYDYATEYYKRAYKRLTYIITLLHGEIPEDDSIIIYEEN